MNSGSKKLDAARAGLCADCAHARRIESARGSEFILCQLSLSNPRFPKYPPLPVLRCPGFKRITADA
jgi:hypothetical protein